MDAIVRKIRSIYVCIIMLWCKRIFVILVYHNMLRIFITMSGRTELWFHLFNIYNFFIVLAIFVVVFYSWHSQKNFFLVVLFFLKNNLKSNLLKMQFLNLNMGIWFFLTINLFYLFRNVFELLCFWICLFI